VTAATVVMVETAVMVETVETAGRRTSLGTTAS
jgi:hypothetical protein